MCYVLVTKMYMIYCKDLSTLVRKLTIFLARFGHLFHIIECHMYLIFIAFCYMDHNYGDCLSQDCVTLKLLGANQ